MLSKIYARYTQISPRYPIICTSNVHRCASVCMSSVDKKSCLLINWPLSNGLSNGTRPESSLSQREDRSVHLQLCPLPVPQTLRRDESRGYIRTPSRQGALKKCTNLSCLCTAIFSEENSNSFFVSAEWCASQMGEVKTA